MKVKIEIWCDACQEHIGEINFDSEDDKQEAELPNDIYKIIDSHKAECNPNQTERE